MKQWPSPLFSVINHQRTVKWAEQACCAFTGWLFIFEYIDVALGRNHYVVIIQWQFDQTAKLMFEASFHPLLPCSKIHYANAREKIKGKNFEIHGGSLTVLWGPMKAENGFCKQNSLQSRPNKRRVTASLKHLRSAFVHTHNRGHKNTS